MMGGRGACDAPRLLLPLLCSLADCCLCVPCLWFVCALRSGWPPANRGPTFEDEDEDQFPGGGGAGGADDGQGDDGYFPEDGEGEHPAPTLLQKVVFGALTGLDRASGYAVPALKYGWLPFVAGLAFTGVWAREDRPAFEGPRFLLGMLAMTALGIKPPQEEGMQTMQVDMQ